MKDLLASRRSRTWKSCVFEQKAFVVFVCFCCFLIFLQVRVPGIFCSLYISYRRQQSFCSCASVFFVLQYERRVYSAWYFSLLLVFMYFVRIHTWCHTEGSSCYFSCFVFLFFRTISPTVPRVCLVGCILWTCPGIEPECSGHARVGTGVPQSI